MNESQFQNLRAAQNLRVADNMRFNSNCYQPYQNCTRFYERPEPVRYTLPELPPLNTPIVNNFSQPVGSLDNGRFLDQYGYDTGLRLQSDWSIKDRHGYNTSHSVDPLTGRIR